MRLGSGGKSDQCLRSAVERLDLMDARPSLGQRAGLVEGDPVHEAVTVERFGFIRRSCELGFSLNEVRALLRLVDGGDYTCAEIRDLTLAHLAEIRHKIADLRRLEQSLTSMASRCAGDEVPECPVIDVLWEGIARDAGTERNTAVTPAR
jgi:DNA-binding transcriptional MerR regulator